VTIYGVDISSAFFPYIKSAKNQNIHLLAQSCTSLPEDWTGRFDLINQNLVRGALTRDDWQQELKEMFRILKPGGHVQLFEGDCDDWKCRPGSAHEKMRELYKALLDKNSLMFDCGKRLPEMLAEIGFENVHSEVKYYPVNVNEGEGGKMGSNIISRFLRSLKPAILRHSGFGIVGSDEEYETLIAEVQREWNEGTPFFDLVLIYAQKPVV